MRAKETKRLQNYWKENIAKYWLNIASCVWKLLLQCYLQECINRNFSLLCQHYVGAVVIALHFYVYSQFYVMYIVDCTVRAYNTFV